MALHFADLIVEPVVRSPDDGDFSYHRRPEPGLLLFADSAERRATLGRTIVHAGGRPLDGGTLAEASAALDRIRARGTSIVVEIERDGGEALDTLLARLNRLAGAGLASALLLVPLALLDCVVARIDDPAIEILVDASAADRDAALAALLATPATHVAEEGESENRRRLAQLGEEVGRIARALSAMSGEPMVSAPETPPFASHAALVRSILRLRRLRGLHFEPALFADPAWDILLDLAAARIEGRAVAVSSLCIAAAVPATTALRWIAQMTEQSLLVRHPDETDGRRVFVRLSDAAAGAIDAYLVAAQRIVTPVG